MSLNTMLKALWLAVVTMGTYWFGQSQMPDMALAMTLAAFGTTSLMIYALTRAANETKEPLYCVWPRQTSCATLETAHNF